MTASDWRFFDDGELVGIDGSDAWPGFTDALSDCVGTRAPRGHPAGISTFWIDRLLERLRTWTTPRTELMSGNATYLERTEAGVRAGSLYEMFDPEEMTVDDLVEILGAWRVRVTARVRPKR